MTVVLGCLASAGHTRKEWLSPGQVALELPQVGHSVLVLVGQLGETGTRVSGAPPLREEAPSPAAALHFLSLHLGWAGDFHSPACPRCPVLLLPVRAWLWDLALLVQQTLRVGAWPACLPAYWPLETTAPGSLGDPISIVRNGCSERPNSQARATQQGLNHASSPALPRLGSSLQPTALTPGWPYLNTKPAHTQDPLQRPWGRSKWGQGPEAPRWA